MQAHLQAKMHLARGRGTDLLKDLAKAVIKANDGAEAAGHTRPEEEIGHEDGDEHEEALTGEAQDG